MSSPLRISLENFPVVPVSDTGTISHHLPNVFPGAPGDCRPDASDACRMLFVKLVGLGVAPWSVMNGKGARRTEKVSVSVNTLRLRVNYFQRGL